MIGSIFIRNTYDLPPIHKHIIKYLILFNSQCKQKNKKKLSCRVCHLNKENEFCMPAYFCKCFWANNKNKQIRSFFPFRYLGNKAKKFGESRTIFFSFSFSPKYALCGWNLFFFLSRVMFRFKCSIGYRMRNRFISCVFLDYLHWKFTQNNFCRWK